MDNYTKSRNDKYVNKVWLTDCGNRVFVYGLDVHCSEAHVIDVDGDRHYKWGIKPWNLKPCDNQHMTDDKMKEILKFLSNLKGAVIADRMRSEWEIDLILA